jgi:pilus assembly protein CpaE
LLSVALLTPNPATADEIQQLLRESTVLNLIYRASPIPGPHELLRFLRTHDPEVLLLDISDWDVASALLLQVQQLKNRTVTVGFRGGWGRAEQLMFEEAGITDLLRMPFSLMDLDEVVYEGLHRHWPIANHKILLFLPAKAGSGSTTVALNATGTLASRFGRKVLLLECDRRSGALSIMLNVENRSGLSDALQSAATMTQLDWQQYYIKLFGIDMVLVNLARRGPPPSWAHFYQLLRFVGPHYDFVIADLPEVVNAATAELVKCAHGVFVVCTPEVPSLKLAAQRCVELEECDIPGGKIHILLNRWERGQLKLPDVEKALGRPVFATLPNDYKRVRQAVLEARLISPDSRFAKSCESLAEKLVGIPEGSQRQSRYSFLRKLARMTE